jgi:UDP-N-acetylmuramoylalanine--D-glutamate ligase
MGFAPATPAFAIAFVMRSGSVKVTVIGFSIEGEDLARYFLGQGDEVLVSTLRVPDSMQHVQEELVGRGVTFRVGENSPEDVAGADLVCVSQGVPLAIPAVIAAREAGTPVRSMTSLFFEKYPGPIVGITGSSGKTTTTSLVDAMFTAAGREHVTGGNIGVGLMALLEGADASTAAVLEISHTQLQLLERSPEVAALTNVTPNHLDQFTWEEYVALKRRIFEFQPPGAACVFNADDPVSRELAPTAPGDVFLFSLGGDHGVSGAYVKDGLICMRRAGRSYRVLQVSDVPLRGRHNVANVAAATAVAAACNLTPDVVARAVLDFKPPEHRLEPVATVNEVAYFNDSIATAPERTLAALRSFDEPVVLLLGGREKQLPLDEMLREAKRSCRAVVCFGEAGPMLAYAAEAAGLSVTRVVTVAEAVEAASKLAQPGDVVLLSPACTSFDAYENFEARGEDFRQHVAGLEARG